MADGRPSVFVRLNRLVFNVESSSVEEASQFSRQLHLRQLAVYTVDRMLLDAQHPTLEVAVHLL